MKSESIMKMGVYLFFDEEKEVILKALNFYQNDLLKYDEKIAKELINQAESISKRLRSVQISYEDQEDFLRKIKSKLIKTEKKQKNGPNN